MRKISPSVEFDTVAREWRCKWSSDGDKASLEAVQHVISEKLGELKALPGVKSVQRVVCGTCHDYKLIIALEASRYPDFEASGFCGEAQLIDALKEIKGVSGVETQTYTLMPMAALL